MLIKRGIPVSPGLVSGPAVVLGVENFRIPARFVSIDAVDADKRIAIIKVVRGLTELGLKEAKDAVTNVPFTILAGKTKGEVEEAKKALEEGGAKCSIK